MRTYIFLANNICGIGGYVQYLYNKVCFLKEKGWNIIVFSGAKEKILVSSLKEYEKYIYTELFYSPLYFRKSEIKRTLKLIIRDIRVCGEYDCFIESNSIHGSVWAELIASQIKCPHFVYLVHEKHDYNLDLKKFLRYKYNRHELAGISKFSISQMLGDKDIELRDDMYFSAFCSNVIDDCADSFSKLLDSNADYTLGSFGRLSKSCVASIIDSFYAFACSHFDKKMNVVMIGGAQSEAEEKKAKDLIRHKFKDLDNVKLTITGNIYPVPISFLQKFDVFVSTAGAANATYQAGLPTVKVTPDGNPLGIIGLDYEFPERNFYEFKSDMTIFDCIERAIKNKESINYKKGFGEEYIKRMNAEFERQMFIVLQERSRYYYDENLLIKLKTGLPTHHKAIWLLGHVFGARVTVRAQKVWQKMQNLIKNGES